MKRETKRFVCGSSQKAHGKKAPISAGYVSAILGRVIDDLI
jgi:hypothetical protein